MSDLLIVETESSPEINFKMNGKLLIKGRAVSDPDSLLWIIAHEWLSNYSKTNPTNTTLILQFDCINTSSSVAILKLLYLINDLNKRANHVEVIWTYPENDFQLEEMGRDFEDLLSYKFTFDPFKSQELVTN